jgi:hypothetical protein
LVEIIFGVELNRIFEKFNWHQFKIIKLKLDLLSFIVDHLNAHHTYPHKRVLIQKWVCLLRQVSRFYQE